MHFCIIILNFISVYTPIKINILISIIPYFSTLKKMNDNYSIFSKIIHRQFLSKNEVTNFFIERINEKSNSIDIDLSHHIFITGLARSGTTALYKLSIVLKNLDH